MADETDPTAGVGPVFGAPEPITITAADDPAAPESLSAYDAETAKNVGEAVEDLDALELKWEGLHSQATAAKKAYELARDELVGYVRKRKADRGKPPYDLFADVPFVPGRSTVGEIPKGSNGWFPPDLWKLYPISRLTEYGLMPSDVDKLKDGTIKGRSEPFPIVTMGHLADFQNPAVRGFSASLTDIKGVGAAVAERVTNADTAFWAVWPTLEVDFAVEKGFKRPLTLDENCDETVAGDGQNGGADGDARQAG